MQHLRAHARELDLKQGQGVESYGCLGPVVIDDRNDRMGQALGIAAQHAISEITVRQHGARHAPQILA